MKQDDHSLCMSIDLQSSCRYASPFAEPRAIFNLVAQSITGLPLPETCQCYIRFPTFSLLFDEVQTPKQLTMKVEFQGIVWNKLVDKHSLNSSNAISNKRDKMFVMHSANDLNLGLELTLPLPTPSFQLLNRNLLTVRKDSPMHITETALSEQVGIRESICCHCQFLICECALGKA